MMNLKKKIFYKAILSDVYIVTSKMIIDGLALMINPILLKELSQEINDDFFIVPLGVHDFVIYPYSITKNIEFLNELRKFLVRIGEISKESQIDGLYLYKRSKNNIFKYNEQ